MNPNFLIFFATALIPLAVGFAWYNPSVFGKAWMSASGLSDEDLKGGNMLVIFGLTYLFGFIISAMLYGMVVHQAAIQSIMFGEAPEVAEQVVKEFMEKYGDNHRSFGHGALHGGLVGFLFAMPILAINSMFERRSFKYIAIHTGYWVVSFILMGGILCAFA